MPGAFIISRFFPPLGSVGGSVRLVKWMKYLTREDWAFTVLTQDPDHPIAVEKDRSEALLNDLPARLTLHAVAAPWKISDHLPDKSIWKNAASFLWGVRVIARGLRELKKEPADLIFTNMPHFINGFIAAVLSALSGAPLVVDMKDDVVGSPLYLSKSPLRQWIERAVERWIFATAARATFATRRSLQVYQARYPDKKDAFSFLPNGCDLDEFSGEANFDGEVAPETFVILNAATRYRKDYRDAEPILKAVSLFLKHHPQAQNRVKVIFLGNSLSEEYAPLTAGLDLSGVVENVPSQDRSSYRGWLKRANLLFLVQPRDNATSIAGTLYEYWAAGNAPVLLVASRGASWDLVSENHLGCCCDFAEIPAIAEEIERVYIASARGRPVRISNAGVAAYDRKKLALQMLAVWQDSLSAK